MKYETATTNTEIKQYDGPIDNSDSKQKLLRIKLEVINGGGTTPQVSAMAFTLTGNTQIQIIYLYTTQQDPTFQFGVNTTQLASISSPAASINFSGLTETDNVTGYHYYWLVFDAIASIAPGTVIDAAYDATNCVYITGPPAFTNTNPSGFRLNGRNYKIGNTGAEHYTNIKTAADGIARFDYDGAADIFMELTGNYAANAETAAITFNAHTGPAIITFRPANGQTGKITQFAPASLTDLITFNGVQKINFDGRANGGDGSIQWTIRNTNAPGVESTVFTFINDASNNGLTYLNIEGDLAVSTHKGLILFSTTTGTTGSDNNTISFCHIRDWSVADGGNAVLPRIGIYSYGTTTAGLENSGNTIDNCQFYNICETSDASWNSSSINIYAGSDSWTITNNHFYQTANYTFAATTGGFDIIVITVGGGYNVSGNYIGGTATYVGGSAYTITSGERYVSGINITGAITAGESIINGNTIANMNITLTYNAGVGGTFNGINAGQNSNFTIGASGNGNIIGSSGVTGGIVLNQNGTNPRGISGIVVFGTGTNNISFNTIAGLTEGGTIHAVTRFISCSGSGIYNILNNNLGNSNNNSSVPAASTTSTSTGIFISAGSGTVKKNFITGLTNTATSGTRYIMGMNIAGTTWEVHNNVILLDNSSNTNDVPIYGIQDNNNNSSTLNIYHNTVKITGTGSGTFFTAALYRLLDGVDNVKNNIFQNERTGGSGGNYAIYAAVTTGTFIENYNRYEAGVVPSGALNNWGGGGANNKSLITWRTAISGAANSDEINMTIDAAGGAGSKYNGEDLTAIVTDDKDGTARSAPPWTGAYEGATTLPVELLFFDAIYIDKKIKLFWTTASEINNNYFTIERLENATMIYEDKWKEVGIVKGAGNSSATLNYVFFDNEITSNISNQVSDVFYYRLKQTDFDGKNEYSKIISVNCNVTGEINFRIYPNPSLGIFFLLLNNVKKINGSYTIVVKDASGKTIYSQIYTLLPPSGIFQIILKNISVQGIYTVSIIFNNESINYFQKIMILK